MGPLQERNGFVAPARLDSMSGALAGVEGIVLGLKPQLRIVLSVTLLQRSVLLEIDRDQVLVEEALAVAPSL